MLPGAPENTPPFPRDEAVLAVPYHGLRRDRTGGQMVWKDVVDRWKKAGLPVVCEDEIPVPPDAENRPLAMAFWYLRAYRGLRRGVLVVDQSGSQRLGLLVRLLRRRPGVRLVAVVHHLRERFRYRIPLYERLGRWNESAFLRLAHRVVVHTEEGAFRVEERGVLRERIEVIPLGVRRVGKPVSVRTLSPEEPLRLLWVGGDFERKGMPVFLEALARTRNPGPTVTVVGRPEGEGEMTRAEERVRELGLEERVRFAGFVTPEALESFWLDHDAYVQPSFHEGHGMALDEALTRGMPTVATDLPAFRERLSAETLRFVPVGDAAALAAALDRLRSREERSRLAQGALSASEKFPKWEHTLDGYEALARNELARIG